MGLASKFSVAVLELGLVSALFREWLKKTWFHFYVGLFRVHLGLVKISSKVYLYLGFGTLCRLVSRSMWGWFKNYLALV